VLAGQKQSRSWGDRWKSDFDFTKKRNGDNPTQKTKKKSNRDGLVLNGRGSF